MKKIIYRSLLLMFSILVGFLIFLHQTNVKQNVLSKQKIRSTSSPKTGIEAKKGRAEYFYKMLKDPVKNEIPKGIRQKELAFAKELLSNQSLSKTNDVNALSWKEGGPYDVGGRTRALAVDINNSNTILAGGITGGMWKSTDKGATWGMKSTTSQVLSVTTIAQDPRAGQTNNWYYASGEFDGSGPDLGYVARFYGGGIYKSTDNGETWNLLSNAAGGNPASWDTPYDYISKIVINPNTGSVFAAANAFGILKSADGGGSFGLAKGGTNDHKYADIVVTSNGTLVAALSTGWNETPANPPGIYRSTDDGQSWTSITPTSFPETHSRTVLATTAANNNVVYSLTFTGSFISEKYDDIRFYKINIANGTSEDRSGNMPVFPFYDDEVWFETQNNYNMTVAVKPDDENFVVIGATNLFRSTNGFSTKPTNQKLDWIGGYHPDNFNYPNLHSDIHTFSFDPTNSNAMWWGHDGGLSYTSDIRTTSYQTYFPWENKNNGYNVTQFYTITIPDEAGDNRIMGGTQDNGSPSFKFDGSITTASYDVSSGDGAYAYYGNNYPFVSSQNGVVLRTTYDVSGNPVREYPNYSNITPTGAQNQLFINPFVIDPSNEDIMLYPAGNTLWRNNQLNSLPNNPDFQNGLSQGWTSLSGAAPEGYVISALEISINAPSSRLYYGAVDFSQGSGTPKVYKLDNAQTGTSISELSINGLQNGMYIHNIAVNPNNGDEVIVIISNYNVMGIHHSTNGGASFTGIEGNLEGTENNPGPSIRGAAILPYIGTTRYIVATSTGVYSTTSLNGSSTVWEQEGPSTIGNVIVNYIASRPSDGRVVAGTHGRGAFVSEGSGSSAPIPTTNVQSLSLHSRPGESGSTSFTLSNDGGSAMNFNISVSGDLILAKQTPTNFALKKATSNRNLFDKKKSMGTNNIKFPKAVSATNSSSLSKDTEVLGDDVWYLDDGDATADNVFGFGDGFTDLYWYNEFNASGFNFQLDEINFFMATESAITNTIYIGVFDQNSDILAEGTLDLELSENGKWYSVPVDPAIDFTDGETFFIEIETMGSGINYPAGLDVDAVTPNKSFYFYNSTWVNLNEVGGAENAAFLIRAVGTAGGGGSNQNPVAVANVSPTQANVNDMINFDGTSSYDNDGNITTYLWNFGDGTTSNQATVQHSYSQANTYNYSLTVTDNGGATNQATGQVTISQSGSAKITVVPSSGTINAGGSQLISLTLDATSVSAGTYVGQVNISTNGGNLTIPIDYVVDVEKDNELPTEYSLSQNYPNPFNPSTTIEFAIPNTDEVSLIVYDMLGREVAELVNDKLSAGNYKIQFNAAEKLSSGVYIYRLRTDNYSNTKKIVLLK